MAVYTQVLIFFLTEIMITLKKKDYRPFLQDGSEALPVSVF